MPAAPHWPLLSVLALASAALLKRRAVGGEVIECAATRVIDRDVPPPIDSTPTMVQSYAYVGCTDREIADRLGLDERAVAYLYGAQLVRGRAQRVFALRRAQTDLAVGKANGPMLIWLGRNELGQSLNPAVQGLAEPALEQQ